LNLSFVLWFKIPYKLLDLFADALFALSGLGKLDMDVDD
jgi:hypothetical protein